MYLPALAIALSLLTGTAQAAANCVAHPKSEQMGLAALRARLQAEGYQIKILKADGNCYELYGRDADGNKIEIYFDTVTGTPVKTHVES